MSKKIITIIFTLLLTSIYSNGENKLKIVNQKLIFDINCDEILDTIFTEHKNGKFIIDFKYSTNSINYKTQIEEFELATQSVQNGLCGKIAEIKLESMDYNPIEMVGELEGFKKSKTCSGINLYTTDGECDSFHYFWNYKRKQMQWWRL
jgi:hypothetical protein